MSQDSQPPQQQPQYPQPQPQQYPPQGYYQPGQPPPGQYPPQGYYPPPQYQGGPPPRRAKGLPWWGIVLAVVGGLVVISVLFTAISGGSKSATSSTPVVSNSTAGGSTAGSSVSGGAVGKVGSTIRQNGYAITVLTYDRAESFGTFTKAKAGNLLVAVELVIESEQANGVNANVFNCAVKDDKGFRYNATFGGKDPALGSQNNIPKGEKVRGWVTFEVPQSSSGLVFLYEPIATNTRFQFNLT